MVMLVHRRTRTVFSFKAKIANTLVRVYSIYTSAVSTTLYSGTVIDVNIATFSCKASRTLTTIVSYEILYKQEKLHTHIIYNNT